MRQYVWYLLLFVTFFLIPPPTYAATYYISPAGSDNNTGTQTSPWKSLSYACSKATLSGSVIHIAAGDYVETTSCNLSTGVSVEGEGLSTTIKSHYSSGALFSLNSSTYNTDGNQSISNIKLDGDNLIGKAAISVARRSNVKIHDINIIDFNDNAVSFYASSYGGGTIPTQYSSGNELYNSTISNCTGTHGGGSVLDVTGQEGILIYNNIINQTDRPQGNNGNIMWGQHNKGMKIYNNTFYKPDYDGTNWNFHIEHWNSDGGIEVYENTFYDGDCPIDAGGWTGNVKGDYEYSWYIHNNLFTSTANPPLNSDNGKVAIDIEGPYNADVWIYYNHFLNWPDSAVKILGWNESIGWDSQGKSTTERVYIRYNLIENLGWNYWSQAFRISSYTGDPAIFDNIYIDNNVITIKPGSSARAIDIIQNTNVGSTLSNLYIRNNIIQGSNRGAFLVANTNGTINGLFIKNNILYNNVNNNNPSIGTNVTNYEFTNNLNTDPLFIDGTNGNFNLKANSPAINAGLDVGLLRDYVGNPVMGLPDIGAYEYQEDIASPPSSKPGDANEDGYVNEIDYLNHWLPNYGKSLTGASYGDFNNNGKVEGLDYVIWLTNYSH